MASQGGLARALIVAVGLGLLSSGTSVAPCGDDVGATCAGLGDDSFSALQARRSPLTQMGPMTREELAALLAREEHWASPPTVLPSSANPTCDVEKGCPLTNTVFDAPRNDFVHVYPGGETICLDGSAFYFQVSRGALDKLHIHFQGGGACWDQFSFNSGEAGCYHNVVDEPPDGIFDLTDPKNPLKDYTLIIISYCSGDMFGGDIEQPWGENKTQVPQKGYFNADAAIEYALGQFPKLSKLALSGSSAGSLGLQLWSGEIERRFKGRVEDAYFIGDSFVGVLYPPTMLQLSESWLYRTWNMCNPGFLTPGQMSRCKWGKLLLQDMWVEAMEAYPSARFSMLNSKADSTQILFEKAFELTAEFNIIGALMTDGQFYKQMSLQLMEYMKQPNFFSYLVDGTQHTFLPGQNLYTVTPLGADANEGTPLMIDWLADFVDPEGNAERTVCLGKSKYICQKTVVGKSATNYCAHQLASN